MRTLGWIAALGLLLAATPACTECERRGACDGDVYVWCNYGSNNEANEARIPCEAPNAACVEVGDDEAQCVYGPTEVCGEDFVDRCEGDVRVYCDPQLGFAEAVDCRTLEGSSRCGEEPGSGVKVCLP